jgi:phosphoglycolate phosphatase
MSEAIATTTPARRLPASVRYLAFDLDGTLTDSIGAIAANYQATFAHFGLPGPSAEMIAPLIGLPLDDVMRRLIPSGDLLPDETIRAWMATYRALYPSVALPATTLFPGVLETLLRCRDLGYRLAVATSKFRPGAGEVLEHLKITSLFAVVAGGDVAPEPKPHPAMLLWLMRQFGCQPHELLMVGDTTFDLLMGRAAGAATVGVTYGAHTRAELERCAPFAMIDRFAQVLELLGSEQA